VISLSIYRCGEREQIRFVSAASFRTVVLRFRLSCILDVVQVLVILNVVDEGIVFVPTS
jgi:hypothetical protein